MSQSIERIKELMNDQVFIGNVIALEAPEDVQKAFAEKGVELSLEEVKQIAEMVFAQENGEEISEAELESVAGGICWEAVIVIAGAIKLLADVGTEINNQRKAKGKKPIW